MGGCSKSCLGGSSTLRFSSLAALTRFVFLVVRPAFLFERFRSHNRHSKGICFFIYVRACMHIELFTAQKINTKRFTETTRGIPSLPTSEKHSSENGGRERDKEVP